METLGEIAVVIPNLNGEDYLEEAIESIHAQSVPATLIIVDNASTDSSLDIIAKYRDIVLIKNPFNMGYTGGVNPGIQYALDNHFKAVALFNNDAIADPLWLQQLCRHLSSDVGIVTPLMLCIDKSHIDTAGLALSTWGLSYPIGRAHTIGNQRSASEQLVFGGSGGASLYSVKMLRDIGVFDQDFFAYYEDADISFRAQLAGWKVLYEPRAIVYHHISQTAKRMKNGFSVYHAFKNMPMLVIKNVPNNLRTHVYPRFWTAYSLFFGNAILQGNGWSALKGVAAFIRLLPQKRLARRQIQSRRKTSDEYIWSVLTHDLPEDSDKLRRIRGIWWKIRGKK